MFSQGEPESDYLGRSCLVGYLVTRVSSQEDADPRRHLIPCFKNGDTLIELTVTAKGNQM